MNENQVNQYEVQEEKAVNNKKKKVKLICGIAIVVIVTAIFGIYKLVFDNPKNVFLKAINDEFKQLDGIFDTLGGSNQYSDTTSITDSSLNFDITMQEGILTEDELAILNEINALNATMNTQYDSKNKQLAYSMNLKHNTSDLFNFGIYGKASSMYLDLKNYFDKYIEIPVEDYESLFEDQEENIEDVKYIVSFVKDSFLNNLEKKDFKGSKETIQIGNENIKTNKITYVFTEKSTTKLVIKILEDIKKDTKCIESLASISGEDKDELKKSIQSMIDELNKNLTEIKSNESLIEISVYIKGIMNETVQFGMRINSDSDSEIRYSNYKDIKRISLLDNGQTIVTLTNKKEKENTYKTTISADTIELVVNSSKKDNNWNHTYKLTESESTLIISGEVTSETKEVSKDKEYKTDTKFTASIGVEDTEELITIEIVSNSTSKIGEVITIPDVSNSVLYTDLTEEQLNSISENILNNQNLVDFINKISTYSTTEDTYETGYDDINY